MSEYDQWLGAGWVFVIRPLTGSNYEFGQNMATWCALMCYSIEADNE